jgi:hypothetical protein
VGCIAALETITNVKQLSAHLKRCEPSTTAHR